MVGKRRSFSGSGTRNVRHRLHRGDPSIRSSAHKPGLGLRSAGPSRNSRSHQARTGALSDTALSSHPVMIRHVVEQSEALIQGIGYIAGILTTVAFVPQLVKTWRSGSTGDLSLTMLTIFAIGILLWLVYGVAVASWPLMLSNAITLALNALLLMMKVREDSAGHRAR